MKRRKPPAPARTRRNPHARALGSTLFHEKVVAKKPSLPRKAKHKRPPESEENGG
jgi:hypothetical protein